MNPDIELFYFINHNLQNPLFDMIMPILCDAGGFVTLLCLCILAILLLRHFKKERYLEIAKLCLLALLLTGLIAGSLKLLINEPRPFTVLANVRQLVIPTEPNSFPSGHTASTLSIVTVLVWKLRKTKWLVFLMVLFGVLVSFSRIYVGVHYPHDVLAGALVGILSGVAVLKFKKKSEV